MFSRKRVAAFLAVGAIAAPAVQPATAPAKPCSPGWVHAVVTDGAHKCLRAGQYCAPRHERVYRQKGFTCRGGRLKRA